MNKAKIPPVMSHPRPEKSVKLVFNNKWNLVSYISIRRKTVFDGKLVEKFISYSHKK